MNIPYIDIHTHKDYTDRDVIGINSFVVGRDTKIPKGRFCAGIHPWYTNAKESDLIALLRNKPANLVAIGEIGIDFSLKSYNKQQQIELMRRQADIASHMRLPVILHCVKGYNELDSAMRGCYPKGVIIHGFKGSPELAENFVDRGYYLSFGPQTFQSPRTLDSLRTTPMSRIFIETDVAKDDIRELYRKAANVLMTDVETLKERLMVNYENIFGDE